MYLFSNRAFQVMCMKSGAPDPGFQFLIAKLTLHHITKCAYYVSCVNLRNVASAFVPTKMELNCVNFLAVTTSTAPA